MRTNPKCRDCGVELNDENWNPSLRKGHQHICKNCHIKQVQKWREARPDKAKAIWTRVHRKQGQRPMNENRECAAYLGVHVAERMLSHVFKNVERMPYGNHGYDFICNKGKMIDVKSSCLQKNGRWHFRIKHNTTADYFLCIAFDNRNDLNPLHVWLVPGEKLNHLTDTGINPSTIHKWDEYKLDIAKVITCCNTLRIGDGD